MSSAVASRRPYTIVYYEGGDRKVIHRRPPPRLHKIEVEDEVRISRKRSENWDEGDTVKVTRITERQPNTLRVEDADGRHTFLSHRDVEFLSRAGGREDPEESSDPIGSRYLLWP
jgi:hypothetical protein